MAVDLETFMEWANDRFGPENIKIKNTAHGTEVCTHSFYAHRKGIEDYKFHLWMNPTGGKSKHPEKGSFRCWKTDAMGSLVHLVAEVDGIPYEEAEEKICGLTSLRSLEQRVHALFGHKEEMAAVQAKEEPATPKVIELPDSTYEIEKMGQSHFMRIRARQYLASRKLPTDGLHVCIGGDYKNRIIIPYYNWDGDLIWYNARLMSDKNDVLRYMKCKAEGLSQEDVLFMTEWPRAGSKIYIMEGEFDALTMKICGLVGCAVGGKFMSDTQIEMIRQYEPVLAFDADDSGMEALINIGRTLLEKGFERVWYVRPPKAYKDWNKLLVQKDAEIIKWYVNKYQKPFTPDTPDILLSMRL